MVYTYITVNEIFQNCFSLWDGNYAAAWVEAENIFQIRKLFIKWYDMMENGEADNIFPDPFFPKEITQELADKIIFEIDEDFRIEEKRWIEQLGKNRGPEYCRLLPHARIAFVQGLSKIIKKPDEIEKEAKERQEKGEIIPPLNSGGCFEYDW